MARLINRTPFAAELLAFPDQDGQEIQLLVLAATFIEGQDKRLRPGKQQVPVRVSDSYFGDPTTSSVRYEADTALHKPYVDVVLNASAYAPYGRPARRVQVELHLAELHKKLIIVGDRWERMPFTGWSLMRPRPFAVMPIRYERAFGGTRVKNGEIKGSYVWNTVGVGFSKKEPGAEISTQFPNVLFAGFRLSIRKGEPAGFGVISRNWRSRVEFAGTYDRKWLNEQWPLLPTDFDPRFNQCAPRDQQSRSIVGGESGRVLNLTPDGEWSFRVPKLRFPVHLIYNDRQLRSELRFDTLLIEPDERRLILSHRLTVATERSRPPLQEIFLGWATPGYLRARAQGKLYLDTAQSGGVNPSVALFE